MAFRRFWPKKYKLYVQVVICLVLWGCRGGDRGVSPADLELLFAELETGPLVQATNASLAYFRILPPEQRFTICGATVSAAEQLEALELFRDIAGQAGNKSAFRRRIMENFSFCRERENGEMLVTGYYEPVFSGSLEKKAPYLYPIYGLPPDLVAGGEDGKTVGRLAAGKFVPYWTRAEIEENNYLAGSELVFLANPLDAFLIQVQGSGQVRLPDGSVRLLRYGGNNGRPYRSIGKVLVEQGKLSGEDVDLPAIKAYLEGHPREMPEILRRNERFIFFRMMDEKTPAHAQPPGSMGQPLTPGHSIALDQNCYATGALALLVTEQPVFGVKGAVKKWRRISRFVFNQDSGSAIKGRGRIDLFLGSGLRAEKTAGIMKQPGTLYFLRRKNETTGD